MHISIFCTLDDPVTPGNIMGFILKEKHFAAPVLEIPAPFKDSAPDWKEMRIVYDRAKRPIILTRNAGDEVFREEKAELNEELKAVKDPEARHNLTEWLDHAVQVIGIEVDEVGATEACWNAADSIEMHLAQFLEGFIYVPGEGIYDGQLGEIVKL